MSTKDLKMESIADLMWTEEEEADPNGAVADLGVNCASGGKGPGPGRALIQTGLTCQN